MSAVEFETRKTTYRILFNVCFLDCHPQKLILHEKLVEALTKYFNEHKDDPGDNTDIQALYMPDKTATSTKAKLATPKLVHAAVAKVKSETPVMKQSTTPQQQLKPFTPVGRTTNSGKKPPSVKAASSQRPKPSPITKAKRQSPAGNRKSVSSPNLTGGRNTPSSNTKVQINSPRFSKMATPVPSKSVTPVRKNSIGAKSSSSHASPALGKRKPSQASTPNPSADEPTAKKRRSTTDRLTTEQPDVQTAGTTTPERRTSRRGSSTQQETSPGVEAMLGVMKSGMTDEEMKQSLMSAIDKKVQSKCKSGSTTSSIPRFAAFLAKKREETKPITPGNKDWKKIHEKQFKKFDSIDVYLDKKRRRAEEITASVKKARTILAEVHAVADKLKGHRTPTIDTPASQNRVKKSRGSYASKTTPFKPTALNVNQASFNFGTMKQPQSVPRNSLRSAFKKPPQSASKTGLRKSAASALNRKSIATPFRFTATSKPSLNTTVAVASTKKVFNLQESLSRPITWKPHKGAMKPLDPRSPAHLKAVSTAKVAKKRVTRRNQIAEKRASRKENSQMARRGIKI